MIAYASIELSNHVVSSETTLPLTVDGKLVRIGLGVGTRGSKFKAFAESLKEILSEGILIIGCGSFEKRVSVRDIGVVSIDLPKVSRGENLRLVLAASKPPSCPVIMTVFVEIEESAVKPTLN